jgi:hypothetical protein
MRNRRTGGGWILVALASVLPLTSQPGVAQEEPTRTVVFDVFLFEELTDVVLVAHSYGGMIATAVADRIPERIGKPDEFFEILLRIL